MIGNLGSFGGGGGIMARYFMNRTIDTRKPDNYPINVQKIVLNIVVIKFVVYVLNCKK